MLYGLTKAVVGTVAGMGASYVSGMAIKAVTPSNLSKGAKVLVGVGTVVIGGVIGIKGQEYAEEQIENLKDLVNNVKSLVGIRNDLEEEA